MTMRHPPWSSLPRSCLVCQCPRTWTRIWTHSAAPCHRRRRWSCSQSSAMLNVVTAWWWEQLVCGCGYYLTGPGPPSDHREREAACHPPTPACSLQSGHWEVTKHSLALKSVCLLVYYSLQIAIRRKCPPWYWSYKWLTRHSNKAQVLAAIVRILPLCLEVKKNQDMLVPVLRT